VNNSEMMDLRMMRVMGFPLGLLYSLKEGRKGSAREVQSSAHTNPAELCNWLTGSRRSEGASLSLEDAQDHFQNISRFEATETTDATLSHLKAWLDPLLCYGAVESRSAQASRTRCISVALCYQLKL
jgi:hypothetical protein